MVIGNLKKPFRVFSMIPVLLDLSRVYGFKWTSYVCNDIMVLLLLLLLSLFECLFKT
jgi:hypothetical protein